MIKIISYNAGGLGSPERKNKILKVIDKDKPDIVCIQEIRTDPKLLDSKFLDSEDFKVAINPPVQGINGVLTLANQDILSQRTELKDFEQKGRILMTEFDDFILYNIYFPLNNKDSVKEVINKKDFMNAVIRDLKEVMADNKPVIVCGDFNIAYDELDLYEPERRKSEIGYRKWERSLFGEILALGFIDAFRFKHPDERRYSHWQKNHERTNEGWRLDYFLVSDDIKDLIVDSGMYDEISVDDISMREDHAPIFLDLDI